MSDDLDYDALGPMQRDMLGELRRNHDADTAEAALLALRDEIAHELADVIRQASAPMACFRSVDMQARAEHGRRMADLIDPEPDRE